MSLYQFKHLAVPDFMSKEAPPNYIAGLGRGATGFTTRSDIGPAREAPPPSLPGADGPGSSSSGPGPSTSSSFGVQPPPGFNKSGDNTTTQSTDNKETGPDDNERFQDPDNETGLFASAPYDADDEEADRIYDQIEKKMDERRKVRREAKEKEELERLRKERPKIQEQFADIRRQLATVSDQEWANIPEVGNLVGKKKSRTNNNNGGRFFAVPDTLLSMGAANGGLPGTTGYNTSIDADDGTAPTATPGDNGTLTDFVQFGQARDKVLGLRLDQVSSSSDSASGKTTVDPKGYLTSLNSLNIKSDAEISDIKKARTLLKSVIVTNPKHAPGWIAAARLEEVAGKMVAARDFIAKGCEACPKSEDIWLESARLNTPENAKIILANAVHHIPTSVKIWLKACSLETDTKSQKRVLRRALEFIPNSVKIWKAAISLEEDSEDARILLSRAVECVPLSVELWLALARLESYDNAKKVLNRARVAIPTSHEIWLTAAKLEEQQGNEKMVDMIVSRAVTALSAKGTLLTREQWIQEAEKCEDEGTLLTCQSIIRSTIGMGIEEEDLKHTWMDDAENCMNSNHIATARAIYAHAIKTFPHKKGVWRRAAFLEKSHGTSESLQELLQRAVKYCPQAEVLWLMGAKEKWVSGDVDGARGILAEAFRANPNSESIWLAAIKLESETGQFSRARTLCAKAREQANTQRVWMKSAVLERQLGYFDDALELCSQGISKFPGFDKLWMIKGQIESENLSNIQSARETYSKAVKSCPKSIPLWIQASRLEETSGLVIKARAILEKARLLNPKTPALWIESVRIELRASNTAMAKALMAKALQEVPDSGPLWSEAILMEPRPQRKSRSADALKKCDNDPILISTIARLFWMERKIDKARNWLNKAVKLDKDVGDVWAWLFKFELQYGGEEGVAEVVQRCIAAEPTHGEVWCRVRKDLKNVGKSTDDILKLVAEELSNEGL